MINPSCYASEIQDLKARSAPAQDLQQNHSIPNMPGITADSVAPTYNVPPERVVSIEHPCIVKTFDNGIKSLGGEPQLKHVSETSGCIHERHQHLTTLPGPRTSRRRQHSKPRQTSRRTSDRRISSTTGSPGEKARIVCYRNSERPGQSLASQTDRPQTKTRIRPTFHSSSQNWQRQYQQKHQHNRTRLAPTPQRQP